MTEERPKQISPKNVCYWMEKEDQMIGNQKSKARKFIELGCVLETADPNKWVVKHIEGYNKTNHEVDMKEGTCSCQFNTRFNKECSHITAVKLFKFIKNYNLNLGNNRGDSHQMDKLNDMEK